MTLSKNLEYEIAKCVAELQRSDTLLWSKFMELMAARIEEVTEAMVAAPPSDLFKHQGAAQEARNFMKLLADAPKLAQRLQQKAQPNAVRSTPAAGQSAWR